MSDESSLEISEHDMQSHYVALFGFSICAEPNIMVYKLYYMT